jgi:hypothetical protein
VGARRLVVVVSDSVEVEAARASVWGGRVDDRDRDRDRDRVATSN